jgi:predicted flavoprotein YhiN
MKFYDTIIIGAGASGLMCAIQAGRRGRSVLLIDSAQNVGEKIRISGGGRCNFTNLNVTADNFLSSNPAFCISALKRFTPQDFIAMVVKHNISYHEKNPEKNLGQLFCDGSSKQIIQMLLDECKEGNVEILLSTLVQKIQKNSDQFIVDSNFGDFQCRSLVIASGGLSIPKMGASDFGYKIAKQFGLKIIPPTAALVPFTLSEEVLQETKNLSGISVDAVVSLRGRKFSEAILFTHKGLSGPAILQISSYWQEGEEVLIDLAPKKIAEKITDQKGDISPCFSPCSPPWLFPWLFPWLCQMKDEKPKYEIHNILATILPKNLVLFILEESGISGNLADLSHQKLKLISEKINRWKIIPSGTEGFAKAEVTKGGVDVEEISSKTFESKKVPNLYFIGEVLDVTGHLGGYNFQWAWASGYAAGSSI